DPTGFYLPAQRYKPWQLLPRRICHSSSKSMQDTAALWLLQCIIAIYSLHYDSTLQFARCE
ncbi:MAG: hypothetical protein ABIP64_05530, partial [Burkholderiales bacterium]